MRILFLDDDPSRHRLFQERTSSEQVEHVWNAAEAIEALQRETFDVVSLDYDLSRSGDALTGYDVAQRLVETPNRSAIILIHSDNHGGAQRMIEILGPRAKWIPFYNLDQLLTAVRLEDSDRSEE